MKFHNLIIISLIVIAFLTAKAEASKLYMTTETTTILPDQPAVIIIMVDTEGAAINAITSDITYNSSEFTISNLVNTESVFPNTAQEDISIDSINISRFSNGATSFTGIGEVARFNATPLSTGNLTLGFKNTSVVVNTSSADTLSSSPVLGLTVQSVVPVSGNIDNSTLPQTAEGSLGIIIAGAIMLLSITYLGVVKYID